MWEPTVSFSVEANIMETSLDEEYLYPFTFSTFLLITF